MPQNWKISKHTAIKYLVVYKAKITYLSKNCHQRLQEYDVTIQSPARRKIGNVKETITIS